MRLIGRPVNSRKRIKDKGHSVWNLIGWMMLNSRRFCMEDGGP